VISEILIVLLVMRKFILQRFSKNLYIFFPFYLLIF